MMALGPSQAHIKGRYSESRTRVIPLTISHQQKQKQEEFHVMYAEKALPTHGSLNDTNCPTLEKDHSHVYFASLPLQEKTLFRGTCTPSMVFHSK